jgi:hypothetical protein
MGPCFPTFGTNRNVASQGRLTRRLSFPKRSATPFIILSDCARAVNFALFLVLLMLLLCVFRTQNARYRKRRRIFGSGGDIHIICSGFVDH